MKDAVCVHIWKRLLTPFIFIQSSRNTHSSKPLSLWMRWWCSAHWVSSLQSRKHDYTETSLTFSVSGFFLYLLTTELQINILLFQSNKYPVSRHISVLHEKTLVHFKSYFLICPSISTSSSPFLLLSLSSFSSPVILKSVTLYNRIVEKIGSSSVAALLNYEFE